MGEDGFASCSPRGSSEASREVGRAASVALSCNAVGNHQLLSTDDIGISIVPAHVHLPVLGNIPFQRQGDVLVVNGINVLGAILPVNRTISVAFYANQPVCQFIFD